MSERDLRRRIPDNRRSISRNRPPRFSPSASAVYRRRPRPAGPRKSSRPLDSSKVLKRSKSEPSLLKTGSLEVVEEEEEGVLFRPKTCADIFSSQDYFVPHSSVYNKDSKVVLNVTVEGSSGPIRTMIKLSANVDETINLVVDKYNEEGRTPRLDKDAASTCELHHSNFSLQSLSRSDLIRDVGGRSFYLRKCGRGSGRSDDSGTEYTSTASNQELFPSFNGWKLKKIIGKARRFWTCLGCIPCA